MAIMVGVGGYEATIETCAGPLPLERLAIGDHVLTYDHGYQDIRWFGRREICSLALSANPDLLPVLIKAGSLGDGCPERDTLVSPAHRVLLGSKSEKLDVRPNECLVTASLLLELPGVELYNSSSGAYIHFMFSSTENVKVNGMWSESLLIRGHESEVLPTTVRTARLPDQTHSNVLRFATSPSQKYESDGSRR